jgi:hypothetical protein
MPVSQLFGQMHRTTDSQIFSLLFLFKNAGRTQMVKAMLMTGENQREE